MRVERTGTRYFSLEEFASAKAKKVEKPNDVEKIKSQRNKFEARHKCRACSNPLTWINGTSVMTCTNPDCKGIKVTRERNGEKITSYLTSYDLLDNIGENIANNVYSVDV